MRAALRRSSAVVFQISLAAAGFFPFGRVSNRDALAPGERTGTGLERSARASRLAFPQKRAEIAGELVVAMHPDGRSLVQFTKTPLPFVVAQATIDSWQVQFVPQNKVYSGRGQPPAQLIWLHLPQCLRGGGPPGNLSWRRLANQGWRLENRSTGESLEGYLAP